MSRIAVALVTLLVCLAGTAGAQTPRAAGLPEWARGGVCYEVFVRSFFDSDGDGIGDLRGLIQKLDYINDGDPTTQQDLGAACIWLMPVAQSPSYHGYDVVNYYEVDREYGTNDDFKQLMAEAHRRGIRVIVDLVLNHSSSQHPFFKHALYDPASPYRDWYLWGPTARPAQGWTVPVWHRNPMRDEFYYGLFWHGMPDLNLANPEVMAEAKRIARFWLEEMGADGFRLDAVGHFFEDGDRVSNPGATHPWLREFAGYVRQIAPSSFTVGEVWDSTGAILPYFPEQLDSYFVFEAADAIIESVRTGSAQRLLPAFLRLQRDVPGQRWSSFLRNHDQTRTMTEFRGDVGQARLAATLLLTLPGFPFLYYGEEIGMMADKPDPRLRTPMHWRHAPAAGFTTGTPWEPLQPDSLTANVEAQEADPGSLLNLHRRLVHLRAAHPALGTGELVPLTASTDQVAAFLRREGDRTALVVANLGRRAVAAATLSTAEAVLPPGQYTATHLLGGPAAAPLRIGADGRVRGYVPIRRLGPLESHVLDLTRR